MQLLEQQIANLQIGNKVTILYLSYYSQAYFCITGSIEKIDTFWHLIQIGKCTLCFSEIEEITLLV